SVRFGAEWTFQLGRSSYVSVRGFCEQGVSNARGARAPGSSGIDTSFRGSGGFLTFTLGAAPGSIAPPPAPDNLTLSTETSPVQSLLTQGPEARAAAREASQAFLDEIKRQVSAQEAGPQMWEDFRVFE